MLKSQSAPFNFDCFTTVKKRGPHREALAKGLVINNIDDSILGDSIIFMHIDHPKLRKIIVHTGQPFAEKVAATIPCLFP